MQFSKTFCKPSSVTAVVPVGLQTILQYNEHGVLQKVLVGYAQPLEACKGTYPIEDEKLEQKLFKAVSSYVPSMISTKGGTTWIYGVMYSERIPCNDGVLPEALVKSYIKDIINKNSHYKFYAGFVHSIAASFKGPVVIRNFLNMAGFNVLPQVIVPLTMTDDTIAAVVGGPKAPFHKDYIMGFFIFEETRCRYFSTELKQITATKDPELEINSNGYWVGTVIGENESIEFSYAALKHHQVTKGTTLLVQEEKPWIHHILSTRVGTDAELIPSAGEEVRCPVCGKLCRVGSDDSPYMCDDPHCVSHMFNDALNMLSVLGIDSQGFEYSEYQDLVKSNKIQCLTDVLSLPKYAGVKPNVTLASAMYSVIPYMPYDLLEKFANKCNNSIESVQYYLENPRRIETDLDIVNPAVKRLAEWLEDPYNVTTLTTIFDIVTIVETPKKFEGDPIFRGNKIVITGRFKRGDVPEIEAILRSYEANVSTAINVGDDLPDVVVTGSTNENISGQIIQKAKIHGIPILEEDDFFTRYEIDKDLESNLL